ncbi:hypothetical protein EV126DRAFT_240663 [Verticillium dahliae]|nr:hypothetical protein EV126DRAFT_240663 [Verticillium dahliae]
MSTIPSQLPLVAYIKNPRPQLLSYFSAPYPLYFDIGGYYIDTPRCMPLQSSRPPHPLARAQNIHVLFLFLTCASHASGSKNQGLEDGGTLMQLLGLVQPASPSPALIGRVTFSSGVMSSPEGSPIHRTTSPSPVLP